MAPCIAVVAACFTEPITFWGRTPEGQRARSRTARARCERRYARFLWRNFFYSPLPPTARRLCLDPIPPEGCEYTDWEKHVTWFAERDPDPSYDGPKLLGVIGVGGMGWSVYDADGPGVTQKTWGQGPGGATGLYWDGVTVRRLSPWEALRLHSIPESVITCLRQLPDDVVDDTAAYRLCGNVLNFEQLNL